MIEKKIFDILVLEIHIYHRYEKRKIKILCISIDLVKTITNNQLSKKTKLYISKKKYLTTILPLGVSESHAFFVIDSLLTISSDKSTAVFETFKSSKIFLDFDKRSFF